MNERLIAAGDNLGEAFSLGMKHARRGMQTDAEMMIKIGEQVGDQLSSSLSTMFSSIIDGSKSAGEAFMIMAKSMVDWLAQIILKQMVYNGLQAMMGTGQQQGTDAGGIVTGKQIGRAHV